MLDRILIAVFILAFGIAYVAEAGFVTDGLVSYFGFDDISGDTVKDAMGNHDGTIIGDLEEVEGKVGNAFLYLRAENEPCVVVDDPDDFVCIEDFT